MAAWWEELKNSSQVTTVFFGGGTPSLLPQTARDTLLAEIRKNFDLSPQAEITLETNPENVTPAFLDGLQASGVNRISLGVQSFQDNFLQALDRQVPTQTVRRAVRVIRAHSDWNWSLDLIMGIPGQTVSLLKEDIHQALECNPNHISIYSLTLKPGHTLYKKLPDEDISADLYECAFELLTKNGFQQYEISNYSRPGFECRHNLLYWSGDDFVGVGPSASSRYFDGVFHHRKQVADLHRYFSQKDVKEVPFESTTAYQTRLEAVFLELRKETGVGMTEFQRRYGVDLKRSQKFDNFLRGEFIEVQGDRIFLTPRGRLVADGVTSELIEN